MLFGERRSDSMENPNNPLGFPDEALYSEQSDSGLRVTADNALAYSPWWRGVNLISTDLGRLPLVTYKRAGKGKETDTPHPAYRLLLYEPNQEMADDVFKQTMQGNALSLGNAYAYIFRKGNADPTDLIPLDCDPAITYPKRVGGQLWYITNVEGEERKLPARDVLHIRGLSREGIVGYCLFRKAQNSIGLGKAAQKYGARYFRNNAAPAIAIEVPGTMKTEAAKEFLARFNQMHQGLDEQHKTALLTQGAKINSYTTNARDSQLLELSKFQFIDVANFLGIPPHKIGDTTGRSYASLEQENQSYLDECLDGWLRRWERECWRKLLREREKENDTHVIEFNRNAILRTDAVARSQYYHTMLLDGVMNKDDVRSRENMNPLPDGMGQRYYEPANMNIAKPDEEESEPTEDIQAQALNGAQIDSLVAITQMVVQKQLPVEAAKALIVAAFPLMTPQQIDAIVSSLESFTPKPTEPATPTAPPSTDDESDEPTDPTEPEPDEKQRAVFEAHRKLVLDILSRAASRIGKEGRRICKDSKECPKWIRSVHKAHTWHIRDSLGPALSACSSIVGGDAVALTAKITASLIGDVRTKVSSLYDTATVDEFPGRFEACLTEFETTAPARFADRIFQSMPLGTEVLDGTEWKATTREKLLQNELADIAGKMSISQTEMEAIQHAYLS